MFSAFSWSQYLSFVLIATVVYYSLIWILVFKASIPALSGIGSIRPFSFQGEDAPDEVITTAQHVIDELRPLIRSGLQKNELLFALQQRLTPYKQWNEPGFRDTITQYIQQTLIHTCSIRIGQDEVVTLWK